MIRIPQLTVALIVQNEGPRLAQLLPTLAWAGEVLVVDGGSSDDTIAVARRHGARVIEHAFDTFAAQRSRALDAARGAWVLSLDADERPAPALVDELAATLPATNCAAFRVSIRSRIFGRAFRFSGTQDDRPLRLVRRGAGRWTGDVHERLVVHGACGQLRVPLWHDTLPDVPEFLIKMRRYTALAVTERLAAGRAARPGERWLAPAWEIFRRGVLKLGLLDGPEGWLFCLLSGLSKWVELDELTRRWPDMATRQETRGNEPLMHRAAQVTPCEVCA